jgi:hypothetical protein
MMKKSKEKRLLSLALLPLLVFSFTIPLSSSANSGGGSAITSTILQFVESVYAVQGTVNQNVTTPLALVTEHITVNHHGSVAYVQEMVIQTMNNGSSKAFPQNFTITDKSTSSSLDYIVHVPSVDYTFELKSADPGGPGSVSPAAGGGLDFIGVNFGVPQTDQTQQWGPSTYNGGCFGGSTWKISGYTFPFMIDWNGPYSFFSYCIDYAWFDTFSGSVTDSNFGFHWQFGGSYSGSFGTLDFNFPTTFSGQVTWTYYLLVA